jgi:hypothetical protein
MTGYYDSAAVHPHPHILSRYQERIAVMAELTAELPVNPDPLAHCNPAGDIDITVTSFGMF